MSGPTGTLSLVGSNVVSNAVASVWKLAVTYALVPAILTHAGQAEYGLWALFSVLSVLGVFGFLDFGVAGAVTRWVAEAQDEPGTARAAQVVNFAVVLFLLLGAAAGVALVLSARLLVEHVFDVAAQQQELATAMLRASAVQLAADVIAMPLSAVAQGRLEFRWLRAIETVQVTLFGGLGLVALQHGHGVLLLVGLGATLSVLRLPLLWWLARRLLSQWRFELSLRIEPELRPRVFGFSAGFFSMRVAGAIYASMDKLILGVLLGALAVKDYDLVHKVHMLALIPLRLVSPLLLPLAARTKASAGIQALEPLVLQGSRALVALCTPFSLCVLLLADPLLRHWIGAEEAELAWLVQLWFVYLLFWPVHQLGWAGVVALGEVRALSRLAVATVFGNLALSLVLVGPLGMPGVIVATVVMNLVTVVWQLVLQRRFGVLSSIPALLPWLLRGYLPALPGALLLWWINRLRAPASLFECALYGALCVGISLAGFWWLGMNSADRQHAKQALLARGAHS